MRMIPRINTNFRYPEIYVRYCWEFEMDVKEFYLRHHPEPVVFYTYEFYFNNIIENVLRERQVIFRVLDNHTVIIYPLKEIFF